MGRVNVILYIKVTRDHDYIILSQIYYVEKMLKRFEHFDYPPISTPYDPMMVFCEKNMHKSLIA
jgi:hypothetical protein